MHKRQKRQQKHLQKESSQGKYGGWKNPKSR